MDGDAQGLDVVAAICPASEVTEIELNLVPPLVEPHRHGADEGLNSSGGLVVASPETPADVLVVEYLHFEGEVLFEVFDDHDEEGELDSESLFGVSRTRDICR